MARNGYKLDDTDLQIIHVLSSDSRTSYRSIGRSVGLSTNAIKTRISKLVDSGIIQQFVAFVNLAILGYPRTYYLLFRNSDCVEEARSRIKLAGQIIIEMEGIGNISVLGIAIKGEDIKDEKIQLLSDALKPAPILSINIGHSKLSEKVRETDLKILKCIINDPRMEISKIANKISVSSKTVSSRLEKMKENHIIDFIAITDPTKMGSYINFVIFMRTEYEFDNKTIFKEVQEELERYFLITRLVMRQDNMITFALVAKSIFIIDPVIRKIKMMKGLKGVEVIIPSKIRIYQDWMMKEIDRIINCYEKKRTIHAVAVNR